MTESRRHLDQAKAANRTGDTGQAVEHLMDAYQSGTPADKDRIKEGFNEAIRTFRRAKD